MVLLGSLFIISGGVMLDGDIEATPAVNAAFLGPGAAAGVGITFGTSARTDARAGRQ